jgi:hypothetical protein
MGMRHRFLAAPVEFDPTPSNQSADLLDPGTGDPRFTVAGVNPAAQITGQVQYWTKSKGSRMFQTPDPPKSSGRFHKRRFNGSLFAKNIRNQRQPLLLVFSQVILALFLQFDEAPWHGSAGNAP